MSLKDTGDSPPPGPASRSPRCLPGKFFSPTASAPFDSPLRELSIAPGLVEFGRRYAENEAETAPDAADRSEPTAGQRPKPSGSGFLATQEAYDAELGLVRTVSPRAIQRTKNHRERTPDRGENRPQRSLHASPPSPSGGARFHRPVGSRDPAAGILVCPVPDATRDPLVRQEIAETPWQHDEDSRPPAPTGEEPNGSPGCGFLLTQTSDRNEGITAGTASSRPIQRAQNRQDPISQCQENRPPTTPQVPPASQPLGHAAHPPPGAPAAASSETSAEPARTTETTETSPGAPGAPPTPRLSDSDPVATIVSPAPPILLGNSAHKVVENPPRLGRGTTATPPPPPRAGNASGHRTVTPSEDMIFEFDFSAVPPTPPTPPTPTSPPPAPTRVITRSRGLSDKDWALRHIRTLKCPGCDWTGAVESDGRAGTDHRFRCKHFGCNKTFGLSHVRSVRAARSSRPANSYFTVVPASVDSVGPGPAVERRSPGPAAKRPRPVSEAGSPPPSPPLRPQPPAAPPQLQQAPAELVARIAALEAIVARLSAENAQLKADRQAQLSPRSPSLQPAGNPSGHAVSDVSVPSVPPCPATPAGPPAGNPSGPSLSLGVLESSPIVYPAGPAPAGAPAFGERAAPPPARATPVPQHAVPPRRSPSAAQATAAHAQLPGAPAPQPQPQPRPTAPRIKSFAEVAAAGVGPPSPAALAIAKKLSSKIPRRPAAPPAPRDVTRIYVAIRKGPLSEIRDAFRTMGISPRQIPEIRFVGKSLAELWVYSEFAATMRDRLEACGLKPEDFDPRSPDSFKGAVETSLAARQARADSLLRGRLESVVKGCKNADVRAAAGRLLEKLPAVPVRPAPAPEPVVAPQSCGPTADAASSAAATPEDMDQC